MSMGSCFRLECNTCVRPEVEEVDVMMGEGEQLEEKEEDVEARHLQEDEQEGGEPEQEMGEQEVGWVWIKEQETGRDRGGGMVFWVDICIEWRGKDVAGERGKREREGPRKERDSTGDNLLKSLFNTAARSADT